MNDDLLKSIEQQLAAMPMREPPAELRGTVLGAVHRELRAAKWDRRLARAATVLLVVGVGLNVANGLLPSVGGGGRQAQIARTGSRQSLLDTAVVVAEATDAATGSRFARQLSAISGHELTADEAAAIDAAVRRAAANGTKG